MDNKLYIGKRLVSETKVEGSKTKVLFKTAKAKKGKEVGQEEIELPTKVYELIVTKDLQEGQLHEILQDKLARKLLDEMEDYLIPIYQVPSITGRIENLIHNLTQEKMAKNLGVKGYNDILVNHIIN